MGETVLLVEDDESIGEGVVAFLSKEGFSPFWVSSFADAQRWLERNTPHAVVADIVLPDREEGGLDLLSFLHQSHPEIPVIVISGFVTYPREVRARKEGAVRFLPKPFSLSTLVNLLKNVLSENRPHDVPTLSFLPEKSNELLSLYQEGSDEALEKLLWGFRPHLITFARKYYRFSPEDAEDLFQELCLQVLPKIGRVLNIRPFLFGTMRILCQKKRKQEAKRRETPLEIAIEQSIDERQPGLLEDIQKVLTPKEWELFEALFVHEWDYKTIAQTLGYSIGSIGPLRNRMLRKIKAKWGLQVTKK